MDGPWDIDPDEEEAMIAEQAEHGQAAADAAAADGEANGRQRPADETLTRPADASTGGGAEGAWSTAATDSEGALSGRLGTTEQEAHGEPEQAARSGAGGRDREWDRAGLRALKAKYGRKR